MVKYERELIKLIKQHLAQDLEESEHKMSKYE